MARPESNRLTPDDSDLAEDEYDYELVEPVAVGADVENTVNAEARLTLPGPSGNRVTVVGDPDDLRRRLSQILAWGSGETAAEAGKRVAEYPMPDLDDLETVPAEEFHDES